MSSLPVGMGMSVNVCLRPEYEVWTGSEMDRLSGQTGNDKPPSVSLSQVV